MPATEDYAEQTYRIADLSELTEHPDNPNQGDVGAIVDSIEKNGWYGALEVQASTGYILGGNHRKKALQALGITRVPIIERDVDDETAIRILLADNRTAQLASYDDPKLLELLQREALRDNLQGTGWDGDDVDDLQNLVDSDAAKQASLGGDYSTKVESPIYHPTGEMPDVSLLIDTSMRDALVTEIRSVDIPADIAEMLEAAAQRHLRFDYEKLANYYAHSPARVQRLMESSLLVIIDYEQAVERGLMRFHEAVDSTFGEDYPDA